VALSLHALDQNGVDTRIAVGQSPAALTGASQTLPAETPLSQPTMQSMMYAVSALLNAVNCALAGEGEHARQHLGDAFRSFDHAPPATGGGVDINADGSPVEKCRGGLAPWQIRRVSTHIEEHLGETILCDDLAMIARLSLSHFMRAFRDSFGCPPHTYLMKRRMERAQGLMLTTNTPLGHIALECGLADQSHLSRLFQKFVGESPAAWRRARVTAAPR
jgi:AraC-like DNA-binding protein